MAGLSEDRIMTEKDSESVTVVEENDDSPSEDDGNDFTIKDLSSFRVKQVLRNDLMNKIVAVVGKFHGRKGDALIVLEKKAFPEKVSLLKQGFFGETTVINEIDRNDIYRTCDFFPNHEFNGLNATITHPATSKHIAKFRPPEYYIVDETPDMYKTVTLPHILEIDKQFGLQWVGNILNGSAEANNVRFNDEDEETGFVLVKDYKWFDETPSNLHLIAIARKPLKSIRDLNGSHIPLLKNIKNAASKAIFEQYNLAADQLRVFLHYQPSYYHLHVHFTSVTVENAGTNVERAHILTRVINNIELMSDYYQKATITFRLTNKSLYAPYETYINDREDGISAKKLRLE